MAKTPIGQPIPVGDPSSLTESAANETDQESSPMTSIEFQPSNVTPAEGYATPAEDLAALPANPLGETGWLDLMQIGWNLAFMPAVAWSRYLTASCKAWESSIQPQWPPR